MTVVYRADDNNIASKIIDQEAIAINLVTGDYFSFSGCGSAIWQALMTGADLPRLLAVIEDAFTDVPPAAAQQISDFLERLVSEQLLTRMPVGTELPALAPRTGPLGPYVEPGIDKFDDMATMLALDPPMPELPAQVVDRLPGTKT